MRRPSFSKAMSDARLPLAEDDRELPPASSCGDLLTQLPGERLSREKRLLLLGVADLLELSPSERLLAMPKLLRLLGGRGAVLAFSRSVVVAPAAPSVGAGAGAGVEEDRASRNETFGGVALERFGRTPGGVRLLLVGVCISPSLSTSRLGRRGVERLELGLAAATGAGEGDASNEDVAGLDVGERAHARVHGEQLGSRVLPAATRGANQLWGRHEVAACRPSNTHLSL